MITTVKLISSFFLVCVWWWFEIYTLSKLQTCSRALSTVVTNLCIWPPTHLLSGSLNPLYLPIFPTPQTLGTTSLAACLTPYRFHIWMRLYSIYFSLAYFTLCSDFFFFQPFIFFIYLFICSEFCHTLE